MVDFVEKNAKNPKVDKIDKFGLKVRIYRFFQISLSITIFFQILKKYSKNKHMHSNIF